MGTVRKSRQDSMKIFLLLLLGVLAAEAGGKVKENSYNYKETDSKYVSKDSNYKEKVSYKAGYVEKDRHSGYGNKKRHGGYNGYMKYRHGSKSGYSGSYGKYNN